jgi:Uma2 family endonuclease
LADPERKTIAFCRNDQPVRVLHEQDDLTCEALLPAFRVAVADIFR